MTGKRFWPSKVTRQIISKRSEQLVTMESADKDLGLPKKRKSERAFFEANFDAPHWSAAHGARERPRAVAVAVLWLG
jgi:hypothetical protein